jgi:hypothetical protein
MTALPAGYGDLIFCLTIPNVSRHLRNSSNDPPRRETQNSETEMDMKKHHAGIGMVLGGFLMLTLGAQDAHQAGSSAKVSVGTFDSRAIAIAYVRSDAFADRLHALRADLEQAQADGDEKRVAVLEAQGPAMQREIHGQGFGTAPVDAIIATIEDELPGIAKEAGVDVIVSKWALAFRTPAARFVDVTDRLAAQFEPDEETLKIIRDTVRSDPVPLDQLTEDH